MITPIRKDKRFILTAATMASVLGLCLAGRPPGEQVLTFLGLTLAAFMGQSQWGQTKRMTAGAVSVPPAAS